MITCMIYKINENINHSGLGRTTISKILKKMGIEEKLSITPQGKPYLPSNVKYVSSAHSGKYLICAIGDQPVGIDIEKIRELHPGTVVRLNLKDQPFEQWTLREAMIKLTGDPNAMFEEVIFDETRMRKIDIEPGYACVIVSDRPI